MNDEVKQNLEEIIRDDINNLKNCSLDDPKKKDGIKYVKEQQEIVNTSEKHKQDLDIQERKIRIEESKNKSSIKIEKERLKLEELRVTNQITIDNAKHALDLEKVSIERERLDIETKRYDLDKEKYLFDMNNRIADNKKNKIDRIVTTGLEVFKVLVPIAVFGGLTLMQFRLVYKDDGRVPSEMKDLIRSIYKK